MPLFEVDATRPLLVQSPSGEPGIHTSAHRVVESHIDGLLGEQVFPIVQGKGPDEPHLLALDASGLPVVVELVTELDKASLTSALDHAGAAGRLTRGELASRYHGGQHAFAQDVAEFYDNVPITQSNSPRSAGARLIIICQEAPQEILNAVDFLRQPTMPVEVLKMAVVKADDGRRFLDVSPLVLHLAPGLSGSAERPVLKPPSSQATHQGNTPTQEHQPLAHASQPDADSFAEGVKVGYALTGKMPVVAHEATAGSPSATGEKNRSTRRAATKRSPNEPEQRGVVPPLSAQRPDIMTNQPTRRNVSSTHEQPPVRRRSRTHRFSSPAVAAEPTGSHATVASIPPPPPTSLPAAIPPFESPHTDNQEQHGAPETHVPPVPVNKSIRSNTPGLFDEETDPDLEALAKSFGAPTRIVWSRPRRQQHYEAMLHPEGVIELADGGRYRHPDTAATAVSGSYTADGWSVWRVGEHGPSLTEAFQQRLV